MNEWRGSLTSLCFWKEPKYDPLRSYSCPLDTLVHWIEPTSPSASTSNTDIVVVVDLLALAPLSLIFTLARAPGLQRTLTSKPKKKLNYNVWFQALHQKESWELRRVETFVLKMHGAWSVSKIIVVSPSSYIGIERSTWGRSSAAPGVRLS